MKVWQSGYVKLADLPGGSVPRQSFRAFGGLRGRIEPLLRRLSIGL